MPKVKRNPLVVLRVAAKLEIVLQAKLDILLKKCKKAKVEEEKQLFFKMEYDTLTRYRKKYVNKLLLEDWSVYGNDKKLAEIVDRLRPLLEKHPTHIDNGLSLSYPYLIPHYSRYGEYFHAIVTCAWDCFNIEVAEYYSGPEDDEEEDDWIEDEIQRLLEKPD